MNLRTLAARDGSMLLAVAWAALGITGVVVSSFASSTPWLLFPFLPAAIALAGAVRRGPRIAERSPAAALLLGLVAVLLIWSLAALFGSSISAGRQILEPSAAIGYAVLAAAVATAFQVYLSRGGSRASAVRSATLLSVLMLVAGLGAIFFSARAGELPACGTPAESRPTEVRVLAEAIVDGDHRGTATVVSRASTGTGADWRAEVDASGAGSGYITVSGTVDEGQTIETQLESVIGEVAGPSTEDLGVESLESAPARHCRVMISGPQAIAAFPPLRWLVGHGSDGDPGAVMTTPLAEAESLPVWRGELDWWINAGGEIERAEARVGGHPADPWGVRGLRGLLRATLVVGPGSSTAAREALP